VKPPFKKKYEIKMLWDKNRDSTCGHKIFNEKCTFERWFHQSFVIPGWIGVFSQTFEEMINLSMAILP